ncbi:MAG: hypothetical protein AB1611_02905 [bacterium]
MNLLWLVLWFLASSWLFLWSVFVPPAPLWGMGAVALAVSLGVVIATRRSRKSEITSPVAGLYLSLPALAGLILILPKFTRIAPALLILGLVLDQLSRRRLSFLSGAAGSCILCALVLLVQLAALPLGYYFGARYHQIPALQPLVYPILKAAGLRISLSDGSLFVQTVNTTAKFSITLERLGFFPFLLYLSGGFMLLFATGQKRNRMGKFLLIICGYCIFRFLILLVISIETNNQAIFWSSIITSLSFLPLTFLLIELLPFPPQSENVIQPPSFVRPGFSLNRKSLRFGSGVFLCSLFLILAIGFHDPGIKKPGRILIDEEHSNWEWTDEKFDTQIFGKRTDYNFYCLSEYLTYFYPQVKKNYQPLTPHVLADTDILILKTPTRDYSDEEADAIQNFVARGGGLFLIGDHTNVFGMSTYLNKVAARFNLRFRYDVTYDLPTYQLSLYRKPAILPHPIVQHVPMFLFGSSCTLSIPLTAMSIMTGYGLRNHYLDYSRKNFFPAAEEDPDYEFGLFTQAAALHYKAGRVLAYSDSTCFSNFFMFIPGKPELLLGSMEWLNRMNRYGKVSLILSLLSLGCLLCLLTPGRPCREELPGVLFIFGIAGLVLGVTAAHLLNRKNYAYPKARRDFFRVALESEHSSSFLPVSRLAELSDKSFLTFFVWIQRLGYIPCLKFSLEEALKQGKAVVIVDPVKGFDSGEIAELKNYLLRGGRLLLMDSPYNRGSTANQILQEFDMTIDHRTIIVRGEIFDQLSTPLGEFERACRVKGGIPLLTDQKRNSILSVKKYGAGLVAVFTASHLFRDESLGYTSSVPDEYQRWLSEIEFWVFTSLAKKNFIPFSRYSGSSKKRTHSDHMVMD